MSELPSAEDLSALQEQIRSFSGVQNQFTDHYVIASLDMRKRMNNFNEVANGGEGSVSDANL